MDIEAYISSGILEAYLLGQLGRKERAEVEALAEKHPEIKSELVAIEDTLESYANTFKSAPPQNVREQLLTSISSIPKQKTLPIPENVSTNSTWFNWLTAASVMLSIIFGLLALYLNNKLSHSRAEIAALRSEKQSIVSIQQSSNRIAQESINNRNKIIDLLKNAQTNEVLLTGQSFAKNATATVFWNKSSGQVFLDIYALPAAPAGKQYQLWALNNGKPVDAGVFETSTKSPLQEMKNITSAQAFAVTLENYGGSPVPDLTTLCLIGNI